ncbi:MAG: hypothetical protein ACC662_02085 [Planctomycetota bacterium]
MSPVDGPVSVLPFVARVLERDGAAVEALGPDALFAVLPPALRQALDLPGSCTLDLSPEPAPGRQPFPLEGAGMQWLIDRARGRGRRAGARLADLPQHPAGRVAKARARLVLPNATVAATQATRPIETRVLLEFGYEARSEERAEGRVHVTATPAGVTSLALAEALLPHLGGAVPERPALDEAAIERAARRAGTRVEREVERRLEGFRAQTRQRLEAERERIAAYHDRLAREAGRRRPRGTAQETLASKREAILRQRAERLDELAERHAVSARYWLASALVLRYEITRCRFRIRRRRREIDVIVEWDPFLGDFLGPPCDACATPGLHLHVCDAKGHATCPSCAARCETCGSVTCKACRPAGCGCSQRDSA